MRFEKQCFVMAAAAIMVFATVGSAVGQVTNSLDSIDFDWKYEMDVNPTDVGAINLDKDLNGPDSNMVPDWIYGTGSATIDSVNGIMTMPSTCFLQSGNTEANLWPNVGFSGAEGFTYEIKAKGVRGNNAAIILFIMGLSDNNGEYGLVQILDNGLSITNSAQNGGTINVTTGSNTDKDHVFRFARNADADGGKWWVWRDGDLMTPTGAIPGTSGIPSKFYFGAAIGSAWDGALEVDYMRLTEGAFKPAYYTPTATKAAAAFDLVYDMNNDPTDPTEPLGIDLDDDDVADWITSTGPAVTVGGGILTMLNESTLQSGTLGAGIWPSQSFTAEDGFTFEISMQVDAIENYAYANTFVIALSDSDEAVALFVGDDVVSWGGTKDFADGEDNTDGQHVYRVSRDSDADGGRWWLWRDGELLSENGLAATSVVANDSIYFGPGVAGASAGTTLVDYVALTDGSFAPVPEPGTLALLLTAAMGLLLTRRKK